MQANVAFYAILLLSVLSLARTQMYYGNIYRGWDAQYYYSLAHSIIFDGDLRIGNNLKQTPHSSPFDSDADGHWEAISSEHDGDIPTKYPIGLSLLEAPILQFASWTRSVIDALGGQVAGSQGYSHLELWIVAIGLILISTAGLATIQQLTASYTCTTASLLALVACWPGTSLFYYSAIFPFMAHAVSFTLLAAAHYLLLRITRGPSNTTLLLLGLCLALLFLVRPQQGVLLIFLAPVLLHTFYRYPARQWLGGAGAAILVGVSAVAITAGMNYSQFGVVTISGYSVGGEGFSWLNPDFFAVLLSPERGLLLYSPVCLIAAFGFLCYARMVPTFVWPFVANAVAQIYIVAAWSSPAQGESFGCRMLSDNAATVAWGIAILFHYSNLRWRIPIALATLGSTTWTMYLLIMYIIGPGH